MGHDGHEPFFTVGRVMSVLAAGVVMWLFSSVLGAVGLLGLSVLPVVLAVSLMVVMVGVMGWEAWSTRRPKRLAAEGRCERCGYDLRGARHEVCPECGLPVWRPHDLGAKRKSGE